jgi:hypothetical protein
MPKASEPPTAPVRIVAKEFWCEGLVALPHPGGYNGRVLDIINTNKDFVALTDVLVWKKDQKAEEDPVEYEVLLIRKGEIQYVVPLEA